MRLLYRSFAFAAATLCAACSAAVLAIDRFVGALIALFSPEPMRLRFDSPVLALSIGGTAIDPALRQSMRHESMTARVGAPRGK